MAVSMIGPKFYAWDRNGKPLAFGKLYTYQARTNIPKQTYQSEDQAVENTNPVILNGEGYANVYLDGSYKMVLKDDKDSEIWSSDPVTAAQPSEWVNFFTATYVNPTTFKISGNQTDEFREERRVRIDNNAPNFSYSTIVSSVFAGGETTVTVLNSVVLTGISSVCTSIVSAESSTSNKSISYLAGIEFESFEKMVAGEIANGEIVQFEIGMKISSGATTWRVVDSSSLRGVVISGGFKAIPLNGLWCSDFGAVGDYNDSTLSGTDNSAAFQNAYDTALSIIESDVISATNEPGFKVSPRLTIKLHPGSYYLPSEILADKLGGNPNIGFSGSDDGVSIVGSGSNNGFNFAGGAYQCDFKGITFAKFGKAIIYNTNNRNEAMLTMRKCRSFDNDMFIDTVGYNESRSTMISLREMHCGETRVFINHFTDHLTVSDSWFYKKRQTDEAMIILSGDGVVDLVDNFYIPHPVTGPSKANSRFIDVICDPAQSSEADRSIKTVKVRGGRQTLEGASGFIHFFDLNTTKPNGESNRISSITVEDMPLIGLAGQPVIKYRQGYPGSVSFRNVKTMYSGPLIGLDPANTLPPVPSSLDTANGTRTDHTIMVDEATRATQGFSLNLMIDPALAPFYYDTTTQTSKFNRSIRRNIDYRLPAVDASAGAGAKHVKVTLPVLFDKTRASNTANRDILSFIVVTVSDARGVDNSNPTYSATAATLVSVVGGNASSVVGRRIIATPLQDAMGGIGYTLSAAPTSVHWGDGDTGSTTINQAALNGDEDNITIVWGSASTPANSWAYVLPLAGLRENYWAEYRQNGVW